MTTALKSGARSHFVGRERAVAWQIGLLLCIWLAQVGVHFYWLRLDAQPPVWDTAVHAIASIELGRLPWLSEPVTAVTGLLRSGPYPPFVYLVAGIYGQVLGQTVDALLSANALFLGLICVSTYAIGRRLGGPGAGFLAALLVSFYPILYSHARHFLLDVPLTAMVTLNVYLLLDCELFSRRRQSAALGLGVGLGLLTKWTFVVFLGTPLLLALLVALSRPGRGTRARNMLLAFAAALAVSGPWYVTNAGRLWIFAQANGGAIAALEGDPAVGTWQAWFYYPHQLLDQQLLLPFVLLFLAALPFFWRRFGSTLSAWLIVLWVAAPYLFFSLVANKDLRYTMPFLPAIAVITALGLVQLRRPAWRRAGLGVLVIYCLWQFVGLSLGLSARLPADWLPPRVADHWGKWPLVLYAENVTFAAPPRPAVWPVSSVLADILSDQPSAAADRPVRLHVLTNAPFFEPQGFRYAVLLTEQPVVIDSVFGIDPAAAAAQTKYADYIISKTGDLGPAWTVGDAPALRAAILDASTPLGGRYTLWRTYALPDGSEGLLWRRNPP